MWWRAPLDTLPGLAASPNFKNLPWLAATPATPAARAAGVRGDQPISSSFAPAGFGRIRRDVASDDENGSAFEGKASDRSAAFDRARSDFASRLRRAVPSLDDAPRPGGPARAPGLFIGRV